MTTNSMLALSTGRLQLRMLQPSDAAFILDLLNQPSWLKYIGDRNVHSLEDARGYIQNGPMAMYQTHGFGLLLVELKANKTPLGMCGLLKRDHFEHPDIGFAFHPDAWGKGYALEAAKACMVYAEQIIQLEQVWAITLPTNTSSIKLLKALGMQYQEDMIEPNKEVLQLFVKKFENSTST